MQLSQYINRTAVVALCSLGLCAQAEAQISTLRHGKLANGLTYYISRDGGSTPGQANFYLLQNVGAILEGDHQQGLAHYLEHMAFNSTEHFPGGVMKFLRSHGLYAFDARTGLNETKYSVSQVPVQKADLTDSVLLILKDWAGGVRITPEDTEKERGIIIEEWRQRQNVGKRLGDAIAPAVYNGSKYAHRNVIGYVEDIKKYTDKDIRAFYQQWYRPDLQCVIIVGDIDPVAYEQRVKQLFSSLPAPRKSAPRREETSILDNSTPSYYRFVDPENVSNSLGVYQRKYVREGDPKRDATRDYICTTLFNTLAPRHLARLRNEGKEVFIASSVSFSPLVRDYYQAAWDLVPYPGQAREALAQVLGVRESLRRDGFTEQEFEDAKQKLYDGYKQLLDGERGLGTAHNYADIYRNNYLYATPLKEFREQLQSNVEALVELEVQDLNNWVKGWMDDKNLAFVTYSSRPEDMNISLDTFDLLLASAKTASTPQPTHYQAIGDLIDFNLPSGKIRSERNITQLGSKEWMLSNGARVLYRYMPELKGHFLFMGSAQGGKSVIAPGDLASHQAMTSLVMQSGLHHYNRNQLADWLRSRDIKISLSIADYTDGIGGNAPTSQAEDFFRYLYLVLGKQTFNKDTFDKYVSRSRYIYETRSTTGQAAVQDTVRKILFPPSPQNPEQDLAFYDKMRYDDLARLYAQHFGDLSQFTFGFVGDISEAEAKALVTKYIASLPGDPKAPRRTYKVMDFSAPESEIERQIEVDLDGNIGEVELSYSNTLALDSREQLAFSVLQDLLQDFLFEELRERDAVTYSTNVKTNYVAIPAPSESLGIHFTTAREQADKLKAQTYDILSRIVRGEVSEERLRKVLLPRLMEERQLAQLPDNDKVNPMVWLKLLNIYAETGKVESPKAQTSVKASDLTVADIAAIAKKITQGGKHRDIVVKSRQRSETEWYH